MSADCCTFECNQGRDCPARKLPAKHHCDKARQPCVTPFQCLPACKLTTANSDGSNPHQPPSAVRPMLGWLAVLLIAPALAALFVLQVARFF